MADSILILCAQSVLVSAALLIFLFTLKVTFSLKAIHGNCKFFLMFTAVGQFCMILAHILKLEFWFSVGEIHNFYINGHYKVIQPLHEFGSTLVDFNNFFMIIERIIACKQLKKYEESGTHWFYLIPSEAVCLALSTGLSYLMHFQNKLLECTAFAFSFEVFSLVILVFCHAHSTKAYGNLVDVNSQYQLREVEYVTRALLPACLTSVLLRTATAAIAGLAILIPTLFPTDLTFQSAYSSLQTINSAQYGLAIILIHRGMRYRAKNMLLKCFGRTEVDRRSPQISQIDKRKDGQGMAYFDQLKSSWD